MKRVSKAIIRVGSKVLLSRKAPSREDKRATCLVGTGHKKKWNRLELLGGRAEAGESAIEALRRELDEETGGAIDAEAAVEIAVIELRSKIVTMFEMTLTELPRLPAETAESFGFELHDLTTVDPSALTPATRRLLQSLKP